MPREHLKTSVVTVATAIQHILRNPNVSILLASSTQTYCESILHQIKEYLSGKSALAKVYGRFESNKWNETEIRIRQRTAADKAPTVTVAGVDKAVTGQHYDVIFLDDIVNEQSITTPEQIEKTRRFYANILDILKKPDGILYVVGTRWTDRDIYGTIIEEWGDDFDIHCVGATRNGEIDGDPIYPKKFNQQILQELLKQKGTYSFYCQYFNQPIQKDNQHFKPPFRYWTDLGDGAVHTLTVDLAISEKTSADYSVVMDCALTRANQLCVVEYWRKHAEPSEVLERIFEYVMKYRVRRVGIEGVAYQRAMVHLVMDEQRKRNIFFEVIPILSTKDKFSKIISLQPRYESGNLLLKQGMVELEDELSRFPVGKHDDIADALAMQLAVYEPHGLSRPKVYIPKEYRKSDSSSLSGSYI